MNSWKAVAVLLLFALLLVVWLEPILPLADPAYIELRNRLEPPFGQAGFLGTDQLGRSMLARLAAGLRWSISVAGAATFGALALGLVFGLFLLRGNGIVAAAARKMVDLTMAFPTLVLAIAIIAVVGQGFWPVVIVLAIVSWPVFARVIEAEGLSIMGRDHVLAARLYNLPEWRILARHILPQLWPALTVISAFHFADMLNAESALSFLGVGAPLGEPSWGNMLSESRQYLHNGPWIMLLPGAMIVLVVYLFNVAGDTAIAWLGQEDKDLG